jgi:putative ABC transport system ATP-binding protein
MSPPLAHEVAVRTRGIDMFFGDGETKVTALKQADFEARRGELVMLVGPSGCGKTTLLSVIAGTLTPQAGTVEVFGQRLDGLGQEELTAFRRKHLGFVFQSFNLIPTLSVLENVMVPLLIQGAPQGVAEAKARAILEKVGLKGREEGRPNALSGGQQQRVAIARALVHEPSLLICDEPTSALDKDTGAQIMQMVRDLSRSPDRCVVVVTHDHRIFRFADRIAEMEDGRIRRVVDDPGLLDVTHL